MLKKILINTALISVIVILVFGAVTRTRAKTSTESAFSRQGNYSHYNTQDGASTQISGANIVGQGGGNGYGQGAGGRGSGGQVAGNQENNLPPASGELSAEEAASLTYMREEEKLAHDVYITLYEQWGLPLFSNISQSELTHSDAVMTLLNRYGLSDPASGTVGVFTNPELQTLYNDLVARGSQSLAEALKVGAAIEEIDIIDLQERLAQIDNADIEQVFNNLLNGSKNHLRSFTSMLNTQTGEVYQPQYLSAETYQAIISANFDLGGNNNSGANGQGGYGGRGGGRGGRP